MEDSILNSVKKVLGIPKELDAFDEDILMNINSVFSILYQIGVQSSNDTYRIEDAEANWSDFFEEQTLCDMIKTYTYIKVRILFDPPTSSFVLESLKTQAQELEWRIHVQAEGGFKDAESESTE